jgi:hypothetical protein
MPGADLMFQERLIFLGKKWIVQKLEKSGKCYGHQEKTWFAHLQRTEPSTESHIDEVSLGLTSAEPNIENREGKNLENRYCIDLH